ncbi:hypothetical protein ABT009_04375 [Streptomyces sp. NPDC002896]|uniref:hypothetical protein n=1 Tax=Streptomyces sp. NPDC002896 TaxID=3154438 RepID=UPI0033207BC2
MPRPAPHARRSEFVRIAPGDAAKYGYLPPPPSTSWAPQGKGRNIGGSPEEGAAATGKDMGVGITKANGKPLLKGGCAAEAVRRPSPGTPPESARAPQDGSLELATSLAKKGIDDRFDISSVMDAANAGKVVAEHEG